MKNTNKFGHKVKKEYNLYHGETVTTYICKKCSREHITLQNFCYKCGNQMILNPYKAPLTFYNDMLLRQAFTSMEDAEMTIYAYYAIDHNNVDVSQDEELYDQYCEHLYAVDANGREIEYEEYYSLSPDEIDYED